MGETVIGARCPRRWFTDSVLLVSWLLVGPWVFASEETTVVDSPEPTEMSRVIQKRIDDFVAAFNTGDPAMMRAFRASNATREFLDRRTDGEDDALYLRLKKMIGTFESIEITITAEGQALLSAMTTGEAAHTEIRFDIQGEPPHLIEGYSVSLGEEPPGSALPELSIPRAVTVDQLSTTLGTYIEDLVSRDLFSGTVLLARGDEPVFFRAYGLANRESKISVTTDTMFDLGSITKAFTKVAIGQLLKEGSVRLDDTILDHIEDYPDPDMLYGDAARNPATRSGRLVISSRSSPVSLFSLSRASDMPTPTPDTSSSVRSSPRRAVVPTPSTPSGRSSTSRV